MGKCCFRTQTARRDEKWFSASRPVRLHGSIRDEWPIPNVADVVEPSGNGPGGQHACRIEQNPTETCNDASRSEGLAGPVRRGLATCSHCCVTVVSSIGCVRSNIELFTQPGRLTASTQAFEAFERDERSSRCIAKLQCPSRFSRVRGHATCRM